MTYQAIYNDGDTKCVQQIIVFKAGVFEKIEQSQKWIYARESLLGSPSISWAWRVVVSNHTVLRVLFVLAPEAASSHVKEIVSLISECAVSDALIPKNRIEHDRIVSSLPLVRRKVGQYAIRNSAFADSFVLFHGQQLCKEIDVIYASCANFAYQLNACRHVSSNEELRWAKKNLNRIEYEKFPDVVYVQQRAVHNKIISCAYLIDEFVAVEHKYMIERAGALLEERRVSGPESIGIRARVLFEEERSNEFDDSFVRGVVMPRNATPWRVVASAASIADMRAVIQWRPIGPQSNVSTGEIIMGDKIVIGSLSAGRDVSVGRGTHTSTSDHVGVDDFALLADQLKRLHEALAQQATEPAQRLAANAVREAEKSAREKKSADVVEYLKSGGAWALSVAEKIGVDLATTALKGALNLP
jgi:hypothetical protein